MEDRTVSVLEGRAISGLEARIVSEMEGGIKSGVERWNHLGDCIIWSRRQNQLRNNQHWN